MATPAKKPEAPNKKTKEDQYSLPVDIRKRYPDRLGHELAMLTFQRPFYGSRVDYEGFLALIKRF